MHRDRLERVRFDRGSMHSLVASREIAECRWFNHLGTRLGYAPVGQQEKREVGPARQRRAAVLQFEEIGLNALERRFGQCPVIRSEGMLMLLAVMPVDDPIAVATTF